ASSDEVRLTEGENADVAPEQYEQLRDRRRLIVLRLLVLGRGLGDFVDSVGHARGASLPRSARGEEMLDRVERLDAALSTGEDEGALERGHEHRRLGLRLLSRR